MTNVAQTTAVLSDIKTTTPNEDDGTTLAGKAAHLNAERRPLATSVEKVAGEQHHHHEDKQEAPIEGRAAEVDGQDGVVRNGLRQRSARCKRRGHGGGGRGTEGADCRRRVHEGLMFHRGERILKRDEGAEGEHRCREDGATDGHCAVWWSASKGRGQVAPLGENA
eukprot:CAMPEP_0183498614 /NCGR_PEP_ID=MMETSP0371-20130417/964_1 /TAXON_ID=268820 /ORGANISM="Peridinium aciculiferum, Strain PAER-2" /LENGTH=165 /DNA_ID=CAMNT_0025692183 /DNA_START=74 /DNA_END=571 /DNA_ORIENTATION=-